MSKNVKDSNKRKDFVSVECHFPQVKKICFGFSHLTTNNHYGLKAFSQLSKKADTYEDLIRKFADWSTLNANEAKSRGKKLGLERIPYKQLSKAMKQICDGTQIVSKDSTVCVFQFHKHIPFLIVNWFRRKPTAIWRWEEPCKFSPDFQYISEWQQKTPLRCCMQNNRQTRISCASNIDWTEILNTFATGNM